MNNLVLRVSIFVFLHFVFFTNLANSGWFWVSTYEECVDQHIKDTKCDTGVRVLTNACSKIYGKAKVVGSAKDSYECIIDEAIGMESDLAVRIAAKRCFDKNK